METLKWIKKITAVASIFALGSMAFAGALATPSFDPHDFAEHGGLIVAGANAMPGDIIGATDVAAALTRGANIPEPAVTTTRISRDITLGAGLTDGDGFDSEVDHSDLPLLADGEISWDGDDYDYRELISFSGSGPRVSTSLSSLSGTEDDYKDGVYLELDKGALGYQYVFDSPINLTKASEDEPVRISFLGKSLSITGADSDSFTAQVGTELFMNVGDTVTVDGHTIVLKNVASNGDSVVVSVDGKTEVVSGTETVEGLEIQVGETFAADTLTERSATLIVGKDATATYQDGDEFVVPCATFQTEDCSKDNPDWVWNLEGLDTNEPTLAVTNDFRIDSFDDVPVTVGGSYDFGGYKVQFNGLTVPDDKYISLEIEPDTSVDLSDVLAGQTSEPTMVVRSSQPETIELPNGARTSTLYLSVNDTNASVFDVVYKDSNNRLKYAGAVGHEDAIGNIRYQDTKGDNVQINAYNDGDTAIVFDIVDDDGDVDETVAVVFGQTDGDFTHLGAEADKEEAEELWYNDLTIGSKDSNLRTQYGIVVQDPESNGANDRVKLRIPADQVRADVSLVSPDWKAPRPALDFDPTAMLDTEIGDKTTQPMILIGGPAVNRLVYEAMGATSNTPEEWKRLGFIEGKGMIKTIENAFGGGRVAIVVAGWNGDDTRRAAKAFAAGQGDGTY